jgi:hypothetical protein
VRRVGVIQLPLVVRANAELKFLPTKGLLRLYFSRVGRMRGSNEITDSRSCVLASESGPGIVLFLNRCFRALLVGTKV